MKTLTILLQLTLVLILSSCDETSNPGGESDAGSDSDTSKQDANTVQDASHDSGNKDEDKDDDNKITCGTTSCNSSQYCVKPNCNACPTQNDARAPDPKCEPFCATLKECTTCGCFSSDPCNGKGVCNNVSEKQVVCACPGPINS